MTPPQAHIRFHCSHCEEELAVPSELAGVTGPCPVCGHIITAPFPEVEEEEVQLAPEPEPEFQLDAGLLSSRLTKPLLEEVDFPEEPKLQGGYAPPPAPRQPAPEVAPPGMELRRRKVRKRRSSGPKEVDPRDLEELQEEAREATILDPFGKAVKLPLFQTRSFIKLRFLLVLLSLATLAYVGWRMKEDGWFKRIGPKVEIPKTGREPKIGPGSPSVKPDDFAEKEKQALR
jgi:hypothetical protein